MTDKSVYLAGPITFLEYNEAVDWRDYALEQLADVGIKGLSPMRAKKYLANIDTLLQSSYPEHPLSTDDGITTRDRNDVMTCGLVLANFLGAKQASSGTPIEFGWADAWRKPVIMVMEPEGNPFDHGMMRSIAGFRVETLDDGLDMAKAILLGWR